MKGEAGKAQRHANELGTGPKGEDSFIKPDELTKYQLEQ
jgi:hypothetical protein